jgi:hypothetical protein
MRRVVQTNELLKAPISYHRVNSLKSARKSCNLEIRVKVELNVSVLADMTLDFLKSLKDLQAKEVLAGFPESDQPRKDADGNAEPITNARPSPIGAVLRRFGQITRLPCSSQATRNVQEQAGQSQKNSEGSGAIPLSNA